MQTINQQVVYCSLKEAKGATLLCILANRIMQAKALANGATVEDLHVNQFGAIIYGSTGIGKTNATNHIHDELTNLSMKDSKGNLVTWDRLDINLSNLLPEDFGLAVLNNEKTAIKYLSRYNVDKPFGICVADEIDRAFSMQTIANFVKFAIDRTGDSVLPWNWFVLAMANGSSDSHTLTLTEHIRGRFCQLYVSTNTDEYKQEFNDYMDSQGYLSPVRRLLAMNAVQTLDQFEDNTIYNTRTVSFSNYILEAFNKYGKVLKISRKSLFAALSGLIGKSMAIELLSLIEVESLPTLLEVCAMPDSVNIPNDLSLRHKHATELVKQCPLDKANELIQYLTRLQPEVCRNLIETLATRLGGNLLDCPNYGKWLSRANGSKL